MRKNILLVFMMFPGMHALGQTVLMSGPTSATLGESKGYSVEFRNEYNVPIAPPYGDYTWNTYGTGTITSSTNTNVSVTWHYSGSVVYEMETFDNYFYANISVSVPTPVPDASFTYSYSCGSTQVTATGTPPGGVHWFWQTSSTGTSTANAYSSPKTVTSGSLYLRAQVDAYTYGWSDAQTVSYTVFSSSPSSGGTISSGETVCYGTSPGTITNTSGCTGCASNQWQSSTDNSTWTNISGATGSVYSPGSATGIVYYRRAATNICGTVYSNTATISVDPVTVAGTVSSGQTAYGVVSGSFTLSGNTGSVQKWQKQEGSGSWTDVSNTTTSLTYTDITTTTTYRAVVKSGACSAANSTTSTVTINPFPVSATSDFVAPAGKTTLGTNSGWYSYQWKKNGTNISGATSNTYVASKPGTYKVDVKVLSASPTISSPEKTILSTADHQKDSINYITTTVFMKEGIASDPDLYDLSPSDFSQAIQYIDGLGRPAQTVTLGGSPAGKDLVQPVVYDQYGREAVKYLPYARTKRDGRYVGTALSEQKSFYGAGGLVAHDTAAYGVTVFEASPLNRPIKSGSPGEAWQPNSTSTYGSTDRTVKRSYEFNAASEVLLWTVSTPDGSYPFGKVSSGTSSPEYYAAKELYRNRTKDEEGHEVIEYVDKEGRTILKRVQTGSSTTINDSNYAGTYYIYNDLGSLVCVIPPEATKNLGTDYFGQSDSNKDAFLRKWAFRYRYDGRKRMILKQVPGADSVRMVYDKRDRLVLTQDGNQRSANQWLYTKYDTLNRPVMTGIYAHGSSVTQAGMSALISTTKFCESYNGTSGTHGYTNTVWPTGNLTLLTATYYDHYQFKTDLLSSAYDYINTDISGQEASAFGRVQGKMTGSKVNVVGTTDYLWTATWYDDKGRVIQTISDNHKGGKDRTTSLYDFVGKVLKTKTVHSTSTHSTLATARRFEYDHAGRLLKTWHRIGGDSVLLTQNEYNELGQLIDKKLHSANGGSTFKQSIDYRYNIRGWLTSMNNSRLTVNSANNDDTNDLFGMELGYNNSLGTGNTGMYNGNISGMKWSRNQALGTVKDVAYNYSYDAMNRITGAAYRKDSASWTNPQNQFSESGYSYDLNGNILGLTRKGSTGGNMDVLSYDYTDSGNQLQSVSDGGDKTKGFIEPASTTGSDYTYDANGNMTIDQNKGITGIRYNHLNLPAMVKKSGADSIVYTYDAGGRKLRQQVYGTKPKTSDYEGEYFYENDTLKFINHEEGRVVMTGATPEYQYHLKDHLGNVRLTFTSKVEKDSARATLETAAMTKEKSEFLRYDEARRVSSVLLDHTHLTGGTPTVVFSNNFSSNYDDFQTGGTMTMSLDAGKLKAVGSTAYCAVYRFFETAEGHRYRLIFDIDFTGDPVNAMTKDFSAEGVISSQVLTSSGSYTLEFTALSGSTAMIFQNGATGHNFNLDNIVVTDLAPAGTGTYAVRLNGTTNEKYGLARSISVMPGDTIRAEVYAKYIDPTSANWTGALTTLMGQITSSATGVVIDGASYSTSTSSFPFGGLLTQSTSGTAPKAYLNWIVFDRDYAMLDGGYTRMTTAAKENGSGVAHEQLITGDIVIKEPGYVYLYLSNEETTELEVFFDDFSVDHSKSPVVQQDEYYPFGATFNSYTRENSVLNKYKYQHKEFQTDLGLELYDFGPRQYDAWIDRTTTQDPHAESYYFSSPYSWELGDPIRNGDPTGMDVVDKALGFLSAVVDNALGGVSPLREMAASHISDANDFNTGLTGGDIYSAVTGLMEANAGGGLIVGGGVVTIATGGLASEFSVPAIGVGFAMVAHGTITSAAGASNLASNKGRVNAEGSDAGTRRKNRLPDKAEPNSVSVNKPGTTAKKYGKDGNVQKEFNKGHQGNKVPKKEKSDHVHDYIPGKGKDGRQPGRAPKRNEIKKDFGL